MTSTHRLIAIFFIWIVLGVALFYAFGISLFVPPNTVVTLAILLLLAGLTATWFVMRLPHARSS
ncbi:MAG: hypothetical protein GC179_23860 [Anaerolineaceae bacterium]|nr:hypothetical protein [Anaerolineaceae bacterium]